MEEKLGITLTNHEICDLVIKSQNGNEKARASLFTMYMALPEVIISEDKELQKTIAQKHETIEDCVSEGYIAFNEAIARFNAFEGASFTNWAALFVKRGIQDYLKSIVVFN